MRLTLLHANPVRGRLEHLPRLGTLINRQRAVAQSRQSQPLLLFNSLVCDPRDETCARTQGRACVALLDALGVQACGVGPVEADAWGRAGLERLIAAAHFPVLATNWVDELPPEQPAAPGLSASTVFNFAEGLVGVIGLAAPGRYAGGLAGDPLTAARREVAALHARGVHALIALSHLHGALEAANDLALARACPEIGVIIDDGGLTALTPAGRVRLEALDQSLAQLDVEFDEQTGQVLSAAGQRHPCDARTPPDSTLSAVLELVQEEAARLPGAPLPSPRLTQETV